MCAALRRWHINKPCGVWEQKQMPLRGCRLAYAACGLRIRRFSMLTEDEILNEPEFLPLLSTFLEELPLEKRCELLVARVKKALAAKDGYGVASAVELFDRYVESNLVIAEAFRARVSVLALVSECEGCEPGDIKHLLSHKGAVDRMLASALRLWSPWNPGTFSMDMVSQLIVWASSGQSASCGALRHNALADAATAYLTKTAELGAPYFKKLEQTIYDIDCMHRDQGRILCRVLMRTYVRIVPVERFIELIYKGGSILRVELDKS